MVAVTVTDQNGCSNIASVTLSEPSAIVATVQTDSISCYGETDASLSVVSTIGGTAPYVYALDGETFQADTLFTGLLGGTQTVTVQDANGCEATQTASIFEPQEIVITVIAMTDLPNNTILLGDSTELETEVNIFVGNDTLAYAWTPSESLSCSNCANPIASPQVTTTYMVTVTDANGCSATTEITINVNEVRDVYIPNAFTPNGDGINLSLIHI